MPSPEKSSVFDKIDAAHPVDAQSPMDTEEEGAITYDYSRVAESLVVLGAVHGNPASGEWLKMLLE